MSTSQAPLESRDEELLGRARAGDAQSFEVVYRRRYPIVLAFLAKRVAQPELAADLLAETFAALFVLVRDPSRPVPGSPIAWLLLTARHLLIDSYRRGQVEADARRRLAMHPVILEDADLVRVQEISATTSVIEELAAQLPADQLRALCARVLDERDYPTSPASFAARRPWCESASVARCAHSDTTRWRPRTMPDFFDLVIQEIVNSQRLLVARLPAGCSLTGVGTAGRWPRRRLLAGSGSCAFREPSAVSLWRARSPARGSAHRNG